MTSHQTSDNETYKKISTNKADGIKMELRLYKVKNIQLQLFTEQLALFSCDMYVTAKGNIRSSKEPRFILRKCQATFKL
jgi:hypothetical protein